MYTTWKKSKSQLALLWFIASGIIFLIIFLQSILGHYGESVVKAWEWFLPTIIPTLSLIIGVLVMDVRGKSREIGKVERSFFRLTYYTSLFYLLIVASTILVQPFSTFPALELMEMSHLWLAPIQALASGLLGAFFIQKGKEE